MRWLDGITYSMDISLSLFEGKPVDEGTTRRGTDTPCIVQKNPQVTNT